MNVYTFILLSFGLKFWWQVDGTDDVQEFKDTMSAMGVMNITPEDQWEALKIVGAILHLGNIDFVEAGNYAAVRDPNFLEFPAYLLGIDSANLNEKLTTRLMESRWGGNTETTVMTLTIEQVWQGSFSCLPCQNVIGKKEIERERERAERKREKGKMRERKV